MPTKKTPKSAGKSLIIQNLEIKQVNRSSVDIKKWRDALKAAEGEAENRKQLYELYADIILDGHLKAVTDKRCLAITNSELMFVKDNKPVEELWPLLGSRQLKKLLRYIIEAKLFGHTLIEFTPTPEGLFDAQLIDRRHVKPKAGMVVKNPTDSNGMLYREAPYYNFTLEVGEVNDFGLMLQAAQYVIYKRGGIGDYADYLQLFGIPFRHGKYKNEESRKILAEALDSMGSAGYAVTPEDVTIEIVRAEGATGANLIFKGFNEIMNDAIAVTILGQTMTTNDSANAGFAQGLIHAGVEAEIHSDDRAFTLAILNTDVKRILANLGYPVEGGEFVWEKGDTINLKDRITIDKEVIGLVPVDKEYLYTKYGIPAPTGEDIVGGVQTQGIASQKQPANQKNVQTRHDVSRHQMQQNAPGFFEALTNFFA